MLEKIKKYLKLYEELTKTYSINILSSAVTYNLILIFLPLIMLLNIITKSLGISNVIYELNEIRIEGIIPTIFLVINLLWSTSTLVLIFNQTGDTIYHTVQKRSYFKTRISSFIYFLVIIIFIILSFIFVFVINHFIKITNNYFIKLGLEIFEFIGDFISVWLISGFIYKKIIPVKVRFKDTIGISFIITIIWYLLTIIVFPFLNYFLTISYYKIYYSLSSVFIFIFYLHIIVKVFILGIIYQYYLYIKKYKK
ncbi:MAG: YihY/virulence factor BrkB family protein [Bacilli bacterium]|nr:YihY/virulence factor BrkB family protein [Bacilli bacterium]